MLNRSCKLLVSSSQKNRLLLRNIAFDQDVESAQTEERFIERDNMPKEMKQYFKSSKSLERFYGKIPFKYTSRYKSPGFLFTVNADIAKIVADAISSNTMTNDDSYILQFDPAVGVITEELLKLSKHRLRVYESDPIFVSYLEKMKKTNSYNMEIFPYNHKKFRKFFVNDNLPGRDLVAEMLIGLPTRAWSEDVAVKIIGAHVDRKFLYQLINSIIFQAGFSVLGRPELYLFIPPSLYARVSAKPTSKWNYYQGFTVFMQLMFDIELISDTIPRKSFLPWSRKKNMSYTSHIREREEDETYLCLIRAVGNKDFYNMVGGQKLSRQFGFFVKHFMIARRKFVIPTFELVVPGCGPRLISRGYTIFTQFGELSPLDVLKLFLYFRSWPEYKNVDIGKCLFTRFDTEDKKYFDGFDNPYGYTSDRKVTRYDQTAIIKHDGDISLEPIIADDGINYEDDDDDDDDVIDEH